MKAIQKNINEYCRYLFKSYSFISELQTSVVGIREGKNISFEKLSYSFLPVPPLKEQTSIAAFLDGKTAQIDRAIIQKEKLIKLLKERSQSLIHNAVTQGLNPDAPMKDSGVEWISEIPVHWEVKRLKHVTNLISIKVLSLQNSLDYIGMENIDSWTGMYYKSEAVIEGLANSFQPGDILFGKLRPYLAKVYLAQKKGICSTEFLIYRATKIMYNFYLHKLMLSSQFINLIDSSTYGSKMPRANSDFIGNQFIPVPPLNEQINIFKHIEAFTFKITSAILYKHKEIEKLKEYKSTLINSAVTGKIKVS